MSIQEKILQDLNAAMKAHDQLKVDTLRLLRANFKDAEIEKRGKLTEEDDTRILTNAAKKRKEAAAAFLQGGRDDLAEKETKELAIISSYLPQQLSPEEIAETVRQVIERVGASGIKDLGKVMSEAMKELRGKADGKLVQQIVRNQLA